MLDVVLEALQHFWEQLRASYLAQPKAFRRVLEGVLNLGLATFLTYFIMYTIAVGAEDCDDIRRPLTLAPTDAHGQLEYCAYDVHYEPHLGKKLDELTPPLCGPDKTRLQKQLFELEQKRAAIRQACHARAEQVSPVDVWNGFRARILHYVQQVEDLLA